MEHKDLVSWHDAAMQGTHPMTQPDDLQQAYDRAMAHNAMLREALAHARPYTLSPGLNLATLSSMFVDKALNATEADVTAWGKKLQEQVMLAVHPLQPEYEKLQQQLATVTPERDALRENITKAAKEVKHELFVWSVEFNGLLDMTHGVDDAYSYPQLEARINNLLTLAQSPPSE